MFSIDNLITGENTAAVLTAVEIAKQDIAIQAAIDALVNLGHTNRMVFELFQKQHGITPEIVEQIYALCRTLKEAKSDAF